MDAAMVIVGAGHAGAQAAATLREAGWRGAVHLVGEEPHPPYERPPLSKGLLLDEAKPAPVAIHDEARLRELDLTLHAGSPAAAIDRAARELVLADGRRLRYAKLLLATGARARRLALAGSEPGGVHYLRSYADACALRARLARRPRVAIVGGGFIGLELAAAARQLGCEVALLEAAPRLLARAVPAELAEAVAARHREAGVALHLDTRIAAIDGADGGFRIRLDGGAEIEGELLAAGIGAVPETALAAAAGLPLEESGIAVDATLRTADADIYAAGDCCAFPHPLYGGRRLRLEAWRNAQDQGAAAARNMLGAGEHYQAVPWFWSDQYELTLQIAGLPAAASSTVVRPLDGGAALRFHLDADGRLLAASGWGPNGAIARDVRLAELLIARRACPDPVALASPDCRLKTLLAA